MGNQEIKQYTLSEVIEEKQKINFNGKNIILTPDATILCGECGNPMKKMGVTTSRSSMEGIKYYTHNYSCRTKYGCGNGSATVKVQREYIIDEDENGYEIEKYGDILETKIIPGAGGIPAVGSENDVTLEK